MVSLDISPLRCCRCCSTVCPINWLTTYTSICSHNCVSSIASWFFRIFQRRTDKMTAKVVYICQRIVDCISSGPSPLCHYLPFSPLALSLSLSLALVLPPVYLISNDTHHQRRMWILPRFAFEKCFRSMRLYIFFFFLLILLSVAHFSPIRFIFTLSYGQKHRKMCPALRSVAISISPHILQSLLFDSTRTRTRTQYTKLTKHNSSN